MKEGTAPLTESPPVIPWHTQSADVLASALFTDLDHGLGVDEVARRQASDGFNELPEAPPPSLLKLFLSQFTSVIVWVLIGLTGPLWPSMTRASPAPSSGHSRIV